MSGQDQRQNKTNFVKKRKQRSSKKKKLKDYNVLPHRSRSLLYKSVLESDTSLIILSSRSAALQSFSEEESMKL